MGKANAWESYVKMMGKCDVCGMDNAEHDIFEDLKCSIIRFYASVKTQNFLGRNNNNK
jgi:uncharacterized protein (DUF983 family)